MLQVLQTIKAFSTCLSEIESKIKNNTYIRSRWFEQWCDRAKAESSIDLIDFIALVIKALFRADHGRWAVRRALKRILAHREKFREEANTRIMNEVIRVNAPLFDTIEKYPLTPRQRQAVASDEDSTLVIAGAGTGKTSTILAKIGLLLKSGQCDPSEILAISFTKKSATELAERVRVKLGVEMDIHTFHKLGLDIIALGEGGKPRLAPFLDSPIEKVKHLDRIIEKLKETPEFQNSLVAFLAYHRLPEKEGWNFRSLDEYKNWLRSNRVVSLDGVPKKSYEECLIANWLIMNGVSFVYEDTYKHDTRTLEYRQYCPDFHLTDGVGDIYIEHFGVDENNIPAPYIDPDQYQQGMDWKRKTHKRFQTHLVETFSWERRKGTLLSNLEHKLKLMGCKFSPIPPAKALELMNKNGIFTGFGEMLITFLTLYKGNNSKMINQDIRTSLFGYDREKAFLNIFDRVLDQYERINKAAEQIDFEDMISRAASLVKAGRFKSNYRYVLVDEFQDISPGRADLVHALQQAVSDCALFCVGDDWQSIYRFAGSDIGAMTHFQDIFGMTRKVSLDTTFRFDDNAIATSSRFVLKNPVQIQKDLKAVKNGTGPSVILYKQNDKETSLDWSMSRIAEHASGKATVLILERYNFHLPDSRELGRLGKMFPNLTIKTMSVHASKGLEADYVIVGLRGGEWGFPATKVDDPLLEMVLTQTDEYPFGEERRLFYVALTRARCKTYLVCMTGIGQSPFAAELEAEKEYSIDVQGVNTEILACEKCKSGIMLLRDGVNGKFYGCSNFPLCDNTQQTCPECGTGLMVLGDDRQWKCNSCGYWALPCPRCHTGILLKKNGSRGPFLGCSNFRDPEINCRYTEYVA